MLTQRAKSGFPLSANGVFNSRMPRTKKPFVPDMGPITRLLEFASQMNPPPNQVELARRMEVEPGHVTNWKKRGLPADRLVSAARAVGVAVDDLLGARAPKTPPNTPLDAPTPTPQSEATITDLEQYQMTPQEQGILELMRMVRPEDHHKVAEAITSIIAGYTAAAQAKLGVAPESNRPFLRPRSGGG
jgi:hypothetical protein